MLDCCHQSLCTVFPRFPRLVGELVSRARNFLVGVVRRVRERPRYLLGDLVGGPLAILQRPLRRQA
eukprot:3642762-Pyramimonas_sp.AAC.1